MSDAIGFEQRLQDLEQRLQELFSGLRGRRDPEADPESPREMEQQAMQRLFSDPRGSGAPSYAFDFKSAREMERQAIERLYGGRSTVVVEPERRNGASS
jgi:hypothetical protein